MTALTRARAEVVTFGCRLNARESEAMLRRAETEDGSPLVVFNTCAVTGEAVRQARQAIRRARRDRPEARIVVTGCAAQIDPEAFAGMAEVDLVIGNAEKLEADAFSGRDRVRVGDLAIRPPAIAREAAWTAGRTRAHVAIQNGCDHRCTFCIIPFGRGPSRSAPAGEIVAETRRLAAAGCPEIVLTGVDITSWGEDLPGRPSLGGLVRRILKASPDLPSLRLSSIDAAEIDPALLQAFAEEPRLAPHLHLSLQAGDDLILKRMKRRHLRADALGLIASVRAVRPETAFGADLIAGFPTETEAMFARTLDFIHEAGLAYVHVFPFSPRPGAPAARMPQVPKPVIAERARRLRHAAAEAGRRRILGLRGRSLSALVERPGRARAADFTEIRFEGPAQAGERRVFEILGEADGCAIGRLSPG